MTRKTRTILLWMMIALFIVLAPTVILYALGYRLDIEERELTKTGALLLRTEPRGATVTIDGKQRGTTPRTLRSLVPRDYNIEVSKERYHTWSKTLTVSPQLVTEARDILLPPLRLDLDIVTEEEFDDLVFSPSGSLFMGLSNDVLLLHHASGEQIASISAPIGTTTLEHLRWSPNEEHVLLPSATTTALITFSPQPDIRTLLVTDVFWGPEENNAIFRLLTNAANEALLQRIDLTTFQATLYDTPIAAIATTPEVFIVRRNNPERLELLRADGSSLNVVITPPESLMQTQWVPHERSTRDVLIVAVPETQETWAYNGRTETWHNLGSHIEDLRVGRSQKHIALHRNDGSLALYWIEEEGLQPRHMPDDVEILLPANSDLESFDWMPREAPYLLTVRDNALWMIEIDGRDHRNSWELLTLRSPTVWTFTNSDNLYLFSGDTLYRTRFE